MKEVFAQGIPPIDNPALSGALHGLTGPEFIGSFLPKMVTVAFILVSVLTLFYLIIGGIRYITSAGDKAAVEAARAQIMNTLVGLMLVLSVFAILALIENIFSINLININLTPLIIR